MAAKERVQPYTSLVVKGNGRNTSTCLRRSCLPFILQNPNQGVRATLNMEVLSLSPLDLDKPVRALKIGAGIRVARRTKMTIVQMIKIRT